MHCAQLSKVQPLTKHHFPKNFAASQKLSPRFFENYLQNPGIVNQFLTFHRQKILTKLTLNLSEYPATPSRLRYIFNFISSHKQLVHLKIKCTHNGPLLHSRELIKLSHALKQLPKLNHLHLELPTTSEASDSWYALIANLSFARGQRNNSLTLVISACPNLNVEKFIGAVACIANLHHLQLATNNNEDEIALNFYNYMQPRWQQFGHLWQQANLTAKGVTLGFTHREYRDELEPMFSDLLEAVLPLHQIPNPPLPLRKLVIQQFPIINTASDGERDLIERLLSDIINSSHLLQEFTLITSNNNYTNHSLDILAKALQKLKELKRLHLNFNLVSYRRWNNRGALASFAINANGFNNLLASLSENKNLQSLTLKFNHSNLGNSSLTTLAQVLYDDKQQSKWPTLHSLHLDLNLDEELLESSLEIFMPTLEFANFNDAIQQLEPFIRKLEHNPFPFLIVIKKPLCLCLMLPNHIDELNTIKWGLAPKLKTYNTQGQLEADLKWLHNLHMQIIKLSHYAPGYAKKQLYEKRKEADEWMYTNFAYQSPLYQVQQTQRSPDGLAQLIKAAANHPRLAWFNLEINLKDYRLTPESLRKLAQNLRPDKHFYLNQRPLRTYPA